LAVTAANRTIPDQEPSDVELLLPFYAAGTLGPQDARRVEEALGRDPELARQYAAIREEYVETIQLNESLGAPSARAMQKLFAAIDAEPAAKPPASVSLSARIPEFFANLTPRTLAWSAAAGATLLLLQAVVIGAVATKGQGGMFQTASLSNEERTGPVARDLGMAGSARALVRFAPDARVSDISTLLGSYQASIVGSARDGMFRLQFNGAVGKDQVGTRMSRLQKEKIVSLAVETP
jgi:anti-sigma factor RsiW